MLDLKAEMLDAVRKVIFFINITYMISSIELVNL